MTSKDDEHDNHIHLDEKGSTDILDAITEGCIGIIAKVQQKLYEGNVCERDFVAILIAHTVRMTANCATHLEKTTTSSMDQILTMLFSEISEDLTGEKGLVSVVRMDKPINDALH